MKKISVLIMMTLFISILSGCGGVSIPTGDGGKVKIDLNSDKIDFTNSDGENVSISTDQDDESVSIEIGGDSATFSSGTDLPKEWPLNVIPMIDGAKITQSAEIDSVVNGTPSISMSLVLDVNQGVSDIVDFYASSLEDSEDFAKFISNEMATFQGIKDGIQFVFLVEPNESNGSELSISVEVPKGK